MLYYIIFLLSGTFIRNWISYTSNSPKKSQQGEQCRKKKESEIFAAHECEYNRNAFDTTVT